MMDDFDWDDANVDHIALHDVLPREAEQVLCGDTKLLEIQMVDEEERVKELGSTLQGRILVVIWTQRNLKIRVITAYEAPKALKLDWIRTSRWRVQ